MTIEILNFDWLNFRCEACEKPVQVQMGTCEKVVCSCGCLQDMNELVARIGEVEGAVT